MIVKFSKTILTAGCLALLATGCATPQPLATYVIGSGGGHVVHGNEGGVQISVEIVTDPQILKKYFDASSSSSKVLKVFVKADNTRADSILVEKTEIQLEAETTSQAETGDPLKGKSANPTGGMIAEHAVAGLIFGGIVAVPFTLLDAGIAAKKEKSTADYNYMKWEFRTATLAPAQSTEGFVYFGGDVATLPPDCHLQVTVHNLSNQTTNIIRVPLLK